MAEQQAPQHFYPAPPFFYTHFTQSNLTQLRDVQREHSQNAPDGGSTALDITVLPSDLRFLVPPPPPADGKARAFNIPVGLTVPPQALAVESLVPDTPEIRNNPQPYLISLARSMLTTFLALTGVLSQDPTQCADKLEDLRVLLYNMHEFINQYRPHQARETLIMMMEERVERLRGEVRGIGEAKGRVEEILRGMVGLGEEQGTANVSMVNGDAGSGSGKEEARRERQRAAWRTLQTMDRNDEVT